MTQQRPGSGSGIRLHQAATSSASWRIRIALALKGLPYEPVWLDLAANDHLDEGYGRIAPTQQVPCLEIDGRRLSQSVAIIEYLEETRPVPPLMPKGAAAKADMRAIVELINSGIQPMHNIAVRRRLAEQFGASDLAAKEWCGYWIERRFAALEQLLARSVGRYACVDEPTAADVFLYPQVMTSGRFGVRTEGFAAITRIASELDKLPAFRGSHPPG